MAFFTSVGILTVLFGVFYLLLHYSAISNNTAEYEYLIKEAHWENYFLSWCQDPANITPKSSRQKALKKFFTKERITEANKLISEYRLEQLKEEIKDELLRELKNKQE